MVMGVPDAAKPVKIDWLSCRKATVPDYGDGSEKHSKVGTN